MPNIIDSLETALLSNKKELAPYERPDFNKIIIGSSILSS